MISGRAVIGALIAATLTFAGTTPAVATERAASGTVDPTTLPSGAAPGIPWVDRAKG